MTRRRSMLTEAPPTPGPAALPASPLPPGAPVLPVPPGAPAAAAAAAPPPFWPDPPPPAAPYGPPSSPHVPRRTTGTPTEVMVVALGLLALTGLMTYPFLRGLPDLLRAATGGDKLVRGFATLTLEIVVTVLACGIGLVLLAVGLTRGSRVAQWLTCLLSAFVAVTELVSQGGTGYDRPAGPAVAVIVIVAIAVIVLLTALPGTRGFFGQDTRPVGVLMACVLNAFLGSLLVLDGLLLMVAGTVAAKFLAIGLGLAVAGAALITTNRPLRAGSRPARTVTALAYAAVVVLLLTVGDQTEQISSPGTVVPVAMVIAALVGLTLPASSQHHFGAVRRVPDWQAIE